jgi:hypothetical protein
LYRVLRGKACQAIVFYRYLPRFVSEGGGFSSISIGFYRESTGKSSIFIAYSGGNGVFYMFCIAYCGGKHVRQSVLIGIYHESNASFEPKAPKRKFRNESYETKVHKQNL